MNLRPLTTEDALVYRALRLQALNEWPPAFGVDPDEEAKKDLDDLEKTEDRVFIGAFSNGELIGVVRVSRYSGNNEKHRAYIAGLYVNPGFRRRGIGRALIRSAIENAQSHLQVRRLNLMVVSGQTAAITLYESLGFRRCGTDYEAFSARGEFFDEIMMTLQMMNGEWCGEGQ